MAIDSNIYALVWGRTWQIISMALVTRCEIATLIDLGEWWMVNGEW